MRSARVRTRVATARVSRERLYEGDLPRSCVKTGAPADGTVSVRFSSLPPWMFLLLLAGVLPFFIALMFAREQIRGQVPVHREVVERCHRRGRRAWGLVGIAAASGIAAVVSNLGWLWWVAAAAGVAAVVTLVQRDLGWVDARPVRGTPYVDLRRVSLEFATAVEQAQADR